MLSFILLAIAITGVMALLLVGYISNLKFQQKPAKVDQIKVDQNLAQIQGLESSNPVLAVIEADKLLDYVLKGVSSKGGFTDRLKSQEYRLKNAQSIWDAHKLRNRLVHDLDSEDQYSNQQLINTSKTLRKAIGELR
ncbi:hypothetical protein KA531_02230 [Candidatus Saccharibacteria bacterium]|nr:hypothetical protein [Candidatus Saccharibacteria bacterium]